MMAVGETLKRILMLGIDALIGLSVVGICGATLLLKKSFEITKQIRYGISRRNPSVEDIHTVTPPSIRTSHDAEENVRKTNKNVLNKDTQDVSLTAFPAYQNRRFSQSGRRGSDHRGSDSEDEAVYYRKHSTSISSQSKHSSKESGFDEPSPTYEDMHSSVYGDQSTPAQTLTQDLNKSLPNLTKHTHRTDADTASPTRIRHRISLPSMNPQTLDERYTGLQNGSAGTSDGTNKNDKADFLKLKKKLKENGRSSASSSRKKLDKTMSNGYILSDLESSMEQSFGL